MAKAKTYRVWVLTDDLEKDTPLVEDFYFETERRGVALWFAAKYPFEYKENTVVRVEEVETDEDGNEECVNVLMEAPILKDY